MPHFGSLRKLILLLTALLMALGVAPSGVVLARNGEPLTDLWIDVSLGEPLVGLYERSARSDDIARIEHVSQFDLFDQIQTGRKLLIIKSIADAERLMPILGGRIDIIGYNLESGPANPPEEQADPVGSVQRMREIADDYGLALAMGPDRRLALDYGAAMAPYVDIFVLQVQRVQTEPNTVRNFVQPMVRDLRRANPDLEISVQIRTEGPVSDLLSLLDSLKGDLDGISILTSVETVPVAEELVGALRTSRAPQGDAADAPGRPARPTGASNTSGADEAAADMVTTGVDSAESTPNSRNQTWLYAAGIFAILAFIAGLIGINLQQSANDY